MCIRDRIAEGPAFSLVDSQNTSDPVCGLKAWKALQKRFGRTKVQSAMLRLSHIVQLKVRRRATSNS
eukprot:8352915-Lingulodinium_polyedra.AAC.1